MNRDRSGTLRRATFTVVTIAPILILLTGCAASHDLQLDRSQISRLVCGYRFHALDTGGWHLEIDDACNIYIGDLQNPVRDLSQDECSTLWTLIEDLPFRQWGHTWYGTWHEPVFYCVVRCGDRWVYFHVLGDFDRIEEASARREIAPILRVWKFVRGLAEMPDSIDQRQMIERVLNEWGEAP